MKTIHLNFKVILALTITLIFQNNYLYPQNVDNIANYIFNILSFINWSGVQGPQLNIYMLDDKGQDVALTEFTGSKVIQSKKLITKTVASIDDIKKDKPQVVYVSENFLDKLPQLKGLNILIIGYGKEAISKGADIAIYEMSDGLHYSVNVQTLDDKGYEYENLLISLATPL